MVSKEHLTFCLQDYGFASRPRLSYYLTSIVSYICQSTEAVLRGLILFGFLYEEEEEQHSTGEVGVVISGCPGHPRLDISESLLEVLCNGAGVRWATIARNLIVSEITLQM